MALVLLCLSAPAQALTLEQANVAVQDSIGTSFRWAYDSGKLTDDKVAHFGVGFTLCTMTAWAFDVDSEPGKVGNWLWNGAFWVAWELKDGLLQWENYGKVGGDGFSWWDLTYSMAGAGLAMLIWK